MSTIRTVSLSILAMTILAASSAASKEPPKPATEYSPLARMVPSYKDGKAVGVKIFAIRAGSIFTKVGIENGDVVRQINGLPITSPETAMEAFVKLKDERSFKIEITRRDKAMVLEYETEKR